MKTEIKTGQFYWVKRYESGMFEPAKAVNAFGDGTMFFYFTNGGRMHSAEVFTFQHLPLPT